MGVCVLQNKEHYAGLEGTLEDDTCRSLFLVQRWGHGKKKEKKVKKK